MSLPNTAPVEQDEHAPKRPPLWVKVVLSLVICWHFFAITVIVSSASSPQFPAPPPIVRITPYVRPYLEPLFLVNAYRFYAPEPGATDLLWVRYRYADETVRWKEMPRRQDYTFRMQFQRELAAGLLLNLFVEQVPYDPNQPELSTSSANPRGMVLRFSPVGQICFASYVRHLASLPAYQKSEQGAAMVGLELFKVAHRILAPDDIKINMKQDDPRLYDIYFVGKFNVQGVREGGQDAAFVYRHAEDLFAILVQDDLVPYLERHQNPHIKSRTGLAESLEAFGLPLPFRRPLLSDPTLLNPKLTRTEIARQFMAAVERDDNQAEKQRILGFHKQPGGAASGGMIPPRPNLKGETPRIPNP